MRYWLILIIVLFLVNPVQADHHIYENLDMEGNKIINVGGGDGGLTSYDIKIGDTDGTPTYGMMQIGNAVIGRTSYNVGGIDLDGTVLYRNISGPVTGQIEHIFTESTGNTCRFALPKSGVGNATYNPRSMLIAGPAPVDTDFVTVGYWQTNQNIFDNLACDTSGTGADLGVQNDLEVEGDIFIDSIKESTSGAGISFGDFDLKNAGNVSLDTISSDANTTVTINLGTDAGDDFIVGNNNALVVEGDNDRVGIGTTSPGYKLEVFGDGITASNQGGAAILRFDRIGGKIGGLRAGGLTIGFDYDETATFQIAPRTRAIIEGTNFPAITKGMKFDGDGKVSINRTTANAMLHIVIATTTEEGIIVQGKASQSANLQEWQDSSGNIQAFIGANGAAVYNEEGNDADFRIEGDTDDNLFQINAGQNAVIVGGTTPDSLFEVDGARGLAVQTVTGNTTLNTTHSTVRVNASGNVTITLPPAASAYNSTDGIGRIYDIKKVDADADTVTIDPDGSEEIEFAATATMTVRGETITTQSNGTSWDII